MPGHKGGRKGTRRKGSNAKVAAPTASAAAIPKAPSHSLVDYSKFDNIEDSSEEEEDTISPGCCCEKCRNAWPHDDPDEEALDENDRHDKESTSMATTKSTSSARPAKAAASSSGFSFSKALGDAAKKQIAEGKAARSANLQASAHRSSSHPDHLGLTKSVSPGKQCHVASQGLTTESAMDRLFAMQNKIISAFLERKGLGRMVPTVVHALNCYRQSDTAEESPDEAVFRIFSGLEIPVDCDEIPSLPAALPTNDQSPKSKVNSNVWTENSSEQLGNVLKKHGFDSFQIGDFPNGQPRVLASAGPFSKKTANGYADSDQTTEPSNVDSDGDEMPDCK